jgi:hypothetical protein
MATTAMDYENANGDRFEGKFILPAAHRACRVPASRRSSADQHTLTALTFTAQMRRPVTIATVVRRRVVTMATTRLAAAPCLPMVTTGTFALSA